MLTTTYSFIGGEGGMVKAYRSKFNCEQQQLHLTCNVNINPTDESAQEKLVNGNNLTNVVYKEIFSI